MKRKGLRLMLFYAALAGAALFGYSRALLAAPALQGSGQVGAGRDERLREELLGMRDADQAARRRWIADKMDEKSSREVVALDEKHTARLREIFRKHGFPGVGLVGKDGTDAAHLLLLHSPSLDLKKEGLVRLEEAAKKGEVPMHEVATLTDKILVAEGKPQIYGMSFDLIDGRMVLDLKNVVDPARLDQRRAAAGLPPLAEYAKGFEEIYKVPAVVLNEHLLKP